MQKIIEIPGVGVVEFPDSMSDSDIVAAIQKMNPEKIDVNFSGTGATPPTQPKQVGGILDMIQRNIQRSGPAMAGGAIGGAIGAPLGPPGIAAGAVFGGAGGEAIRQLINRAIGAGDVPATPEGAAGALAEGALTGLGQEIGGIASKQATGGFAGLLERSGQRSVERILQPTTRPNKFSTNQIKGELAGRGPIAFSQGQYLAKLEKAADKASAELDKAWAALPSNVKLKTQPILNALEKTKSQWIVDGKVIEPTSVDKIDEIIDVVKQFGNDVSPESLRKVRQIWDRSVSRVKGYQGKDLAESSAIYAREQGANAIRRQLGKVFPDIKALNAEFNFWHKASDIMEETVERKSGQFGKSLEVFSAMTGAVGNMARGGSILESAGMATAMAALASAVKSTAWKSTSAFTKSRIASALMSGEAQVASEIIGRIGGGVVSQKLTPRGNN